ncbi:MAG: CPBP family intramembrane metalloprotease [Chloroflexi bacterium]|nr:CPBP family intramembrane metalloprotease [Chloroflexota bacterium]
MKRAAPRSLAARLFLTPGERRLRAGWRLLGHALLIFAFTLLFSLPAGLLFAREASALSIAAREGILLGAQAAAVVAATLLARRLLDRRSIASLGLRLDRRSLPDYAFGFGLAGAQMGSIFLALRAAGWLRIQGYAWQGASPGEWLWPLAGWLALFVGVGFYEELLSRGYHLQNLAEGLNLPLGLFLSSAVFAGLHLTNPGATWTSTLGILAAGYFLAYPWLRTRQLWLSFGLHAGWNFFEGQVFGFPVSGLGGFHLIRQTVAGPALITGGAFGPEAGLIVLPAMLLGAGLVYLYARGRGG